MGALDLTPQFVKEYDRLETELNDLRRSQSTPPVIDGDDAGTRLRKQLEEARSELASATQELSVQRECASQLEAALEQATRDQRQLFEMGHAGTDLRNQLEEARSELAELTRELSKQRERANRLEARLEQETRDKPPPPTPTDVLLAVAKYELGIERDKVRKLEKENDDLRDALHEYER
jgi:DNA repair exonuclease SbcCD ATPase subunit